jgi:hypothetical protein
MRHGSRPPVNEVFCDPSTRKWQMTKRKTKPTKREPTEREAQHSRRAVDLLQTRPPRTEIVWRGDAVASPHIDRRGHHAALMAAFGTSSPDFVAVQLAAVERSSRARGGHLGDDASALNAALAFMEAAQPANEIQAALAVQLTGLHALAAELIGRAKTCDSMEHLAIFTGLATKVSRTFAEQLETLSRLRGDNQQRMEIKHVHIGNVIGDIHPRGGGNVAYEHQPLAPCPAPPTSPALPSPVEAIRPTLPSTGCTRKSPLPLARRR